MTTLTVLRDIIDKRVSIPTLPVVVDKLNAVLEDPEATPRDMAVELANDPATSSKVLRIANSAFYGLRQSVPTVERAAAVLGMDALRNLVLQSAVLGMFDHVENERFGISRVWVHSILTARLCVLVGGRTRLSHAVLIAENLYTCGLLHDIGRIALYDSLGEEYLQLVQRADEEGKTLWVAEEEVLGFSHCDVGSLIALRWKLPDEITEAIQGHHGKVSDSSGCPEATVVFVANQLAHAIEERDGSVLKLAEPRARLLGLTREAVIEVVREGNAILGQIEL